MNASYFCVDLQIDFSNHHAKNVSSMQLYLAAFVLILNNIPCLKRESNATPSDSRDGADKIIILMI